MVWIDIIVKAPNQRQDDQTVKCELDWTVLQLKSHLSSVYPTKPRVEDQRLIYSGHLLKNEQSLREVLQPTDDNLIFTIHMVCAQSASESPKRQSNSMASNSSTNDTNERTSQSSVDNSQNNFFPNQINGQYVYPNLYNAGVYNPSVVIPPDQMWQQMALLQQTYAQYMAQYMTQNPYLNQNVTNNQMPPTVAIVPPNVVPVVNMANVPAANVAVAAQPPQPVQRLNAGPGQQAIDDDEEQRNRDWLDYFYWMSRAVVLFSIIYFYSSFTRFLLVVFLSLVLYLYQTNWFNHRRQQNVINNNNNDNAVNREVRGPERQQQNEANEENTEAIDRLRQIAANNTAVNDRVTEDRFTGLRFFWVFVSSLFTSLIPDNPAVPVNIN